MAKPREHLVEDVLHLLRMGVSIPLVSKQLGVSNRTIVRALTEAGRLEEARPFSVEETLLRGKNRAAHIERRGS